jgi:hypothetical protein
MSRGTPGKEGGLAAAAGAGSSLWAGAAARVDEFTFRYNRRDAGEGERMNDFLGRTVGRLTYKALIA